MRISKPFAVVALYPNGKLWIISSPKTTNAQHKEIDITKALEQWLKDYRKKTKNLA